MLPLQERCCHGSYVIRWDEPGDSPETSVCRPRYMTLGRIWACLLLFLVDASTLVLWWAVAFWRLARKHVRSFSDYQVGDRVDARSETGVSGLQKSFFGCYSSIQLPCDHCWRAMENHPKFPKFQSTSSRYHSILLWAPSFVIQQTHAMCMPVEER